MGLRDSEEKLMQHFFTDPARVSRDRIFIEGNDVNHMKNVLRMKPGERVCISDGAGNSYLCFIDSYTDEGAELSIYGIPEQDTELPSKIFLFQGLPKGDKMEWIVQKAVELGAAGVIPFAAKRSVSKLDEKKAEKKQKRWQAIAKGAAEQSGRSIIPEIKKAVSYEEALRMAEKMDVRLIPYELEKGMEETARVIEGITPGQSVGIFIGPEGGFEESEIEQARAAGAVPVSLGKRILRTETAGLAALSVLMYHLEAHGHNLVERKA